MYSYDHVTQQQPISEERRLGDDPEEVPQRTEAQRERGQAQTQTQTQATVQTQKAQVEAQQPANAAGLLAESTVELDASVSTKTEGESLPEVEAEEVKAGGGVEAGLEGEGAETMRAFPAGVVPYFARVPEGQGSGSLPYEVYSGRKIRKSECMFLLTLQVRTAIVELRVLILVALAIKHSLIIAR